MESTSILQIVSRFKPNVDGMGDFSRLLGGEFWRTYRIRSHFLVYEKPKTPLDAAEIAPDTVSYPAEATPEACLEEALALTGAHRFRCVLLHYGPYGYSWRGTPAAFCRAIEQLAARLDVLIFFHENYADGPPWKRAFWTRREQRQSMERLQRIAKVSFTSNEKYAALLKRSKPQGQALVRIPIFSNMGEPRGLRPLAERRRQMIVFGQLSTRLRLYKARKTLEDLCRWLGIESIVDVGSGSDPRIPNLILGATVRKAGWLAETEVSALLAESTAGVICYWPDVWEKSGVIAAYQAHALLPILVPLDKRRLPRPPYVPYVELDDLRYLRGSEGKIPDAAVQAIVDKSHSYYVANQSLARCAEVIAAQILTW
jgi:hypothetical protein